jgi:3-oxoacyl-[acyl-carrier-protein] synthase II
MKDRIVITGTGLVSSLGFTASETWKALLDGKCGIRTIEDFDAGGFECTAAAQVLSLNPDDLDIHPRDARIMDKHAHMLMKCGQNAFRSAGLEKADIPPEDIGFFAGMGMVDYNIDDLLPAIVKSLDSTGNIDYDTFYSEAYQDIFPLWPLTMLNNISFCQVAINLGIKGDNTVFCPHADSGLHAVIEAMHSLYEGKARIVLAGGVSEKVSPMSMARASLFEILNKDDAACRPFDDHCAGTLLGEGCGIVSLERESSAKERHMPYSVAVTGYGTSFTREPDHYCPTSEAIAHSMNHAISTAGIKSDDIDLVIAHGDGTIEGDRNEQSALNAVFGGSMGSIRLYSSKASLGHTLAGAPGIDLILGMYSIENGIIPPVYGRSPDSRVSQNLVFNNPLTRDVKRILLNALSYEGQCASLIIEAIQ